MQVYYLAIFPRGNCNFETIRVVLDLSFYAILQVDGSVVTKQGVRFVFTDGSRIIFRLSVCATWLFSFQHLKLYMFHFSFL